ncbi:MAG: hypothetical protein EXR59_03255 [Dehalococcoidia bacterium]|nr:hypothetical protein [Dehalococcoidia bacterium]
MEKAKETMVLKRILLLRFALFLLLASGACNGDGANANTSDSAAILSSIPENAVFLGSLKIDALLKDAKLQSTIGETLKDRGQSNGTDIQSFLGGKADYGIDPKDIKDVVFFGTADVIGDTKDENKDAAVFIKGKYDKEKVAAALNTKSETPMTAQPYKDADVRATADGKNAIGFVGDDLIVVGTTKMVHAVIDIRKGDSNPLAGALPLKFQSLGSPMLKLAAVLTPDSLKSLGEPGNSALPIDTDALTQISGISLSLDKTGDSLSFALSMDYPSNETAKKASDGINGLISLFKSASNDPDVSKGLESVNVRNGGKSVEISGKLKTSTLQDLNKNFAD